MITGKTPSYLGFAVSTLGQSHKASGVCQDASGFYSNKNVSILAVSDGHGGEKHFRSDIGSKIAVDVGISSIKCFISNYPSLSGLQKKDIDSLFKQLKENIIYSWNEGISNHLSNNPLNNEEINKLSTYDKDEYLSSSKITNYASIYGATFIAACVTSKFHFIIQLGDGDAVIKDTRGYYMPMPIDEKLHFNVTTSLCEKDAIDSFRHFYKQSLPISIILSTDGLKNSFVNVDYLYSLYDDILNDAKVESVEDLSRGLFEDLPVLSQKGSGDDISLAMMWDPKELNND